MESNICYEVDMSREEWRDIPELEGVAQASNWGRFKVLPYTATTIKGVINHYKEKYPRISTRGQVTIGGKQYSANKLIARTFITHYIEGMPVTNINGDMTDCNLTNIKCGINFITHRESISNKDIHATGEIIEGIPVLEGGFNEGQKIIFDITLANKIGKSVSLFRTTNITPNLDKWEKGVDYIDLMEYANFNDYIPLLLELGYTQMGLINTEHIYIFSERGTAKLMSTLHNSNPAKWEFLNNFVNEYFEMRKELKEQSNSIEQQKKDLLFAIYTGGQAGIIASKQLTELEVQEATAPLIETIEEQKPKVDKFDKYMETDGTYNATNTAKLLGISSAKKFNSMLKEKKIQYKTGNNWVLYSKYQWLIDNGYCKYIEGENSNYSYMQLRWYPKGIDWLRDNILVVQATYY